MSGGYPPKLQRIIGLFESLPEMERRELLVAYADQAPGAAPREGEEFDMVDERKDEECADTVGVFLKVDDAQRAHFRMRLGPQVQTLTRAMTAILSKSLEGEKVEEILELPADFVPKIVGGELVRVRSQTVYYILTRLKGICRAYMNRVRAAQAGS
jgi:cysteine desulfuration protein SufE